MGRKKKVDPDAWIQEYKDKYGYDPVGFKEVLMKLPIKVKGNGLVRGGTRPLGEVINPAQLKLIDDIIASRKAGKPFRRIQIKVRQLAAFSTITGAILWADCLVNGDGCDAIVTAHQPDSLRALSQMYRRFAGEKDSKAGKARVADKGFRTESGGYLNLWSSKDIRSGDAVHAHWSEADYIDGFTEKWNAFIPSMNDTPQSIIILETTTKRGEETEFREMVEKVYRGEMEGWTVDFTSWQSLPANKMDVTDDAGFEATWGDYERQLHLRGLSDEQIRWWQHMCSSKFMGSSTAMIEAYPSSIEEAMLASATHQYYFKESMEFLQTGVRDPINRFLLAYDGVRLTTDPREFFDHPHFMQYAEPKANHRYIIGADGADAEQRNVATEGSECYAVVLDDTNGEVVGEFHGYMNLQEFATGIWQMAKWYNHAHIVPEINKAQGVIDYLTDTLSYFNIYERAPLKFGFSTTAGSRPTLVGRLQDNINRKTLIIPSENLMKQLVKFGKKRGKAEKKQSRKGVTPDDGCIALALCMMGTENSVNGAWHEKAPADLDSSLRIDTTERAEDTRRRFFELDIDNPDMDFYDDLNRRRRAWGLT